MFLWNFPNEKLTKPHLEVVCGQVRMHCFVGARDRYGSCQLVDLEWLELLSTFFPAIKEFIFDRLLLSDTSCFAKVFLNFSTFLASLTRWE